MFGVKSLWAPVTGCGEDWQRKGALGMWREAAGRIQHLPVPDMTHRDYNEEKKRPVSLALQSSQNRLEGQSHEVSK